MAVAEGTGVDVFYENSDTVLADLAAVNTLADDANKLKNVTDLGALDSSINIIEFPVYGEKIAQKTAGLETPADLTLDIAYDPNDTDHKELAASAIVGDKVNIAVEVSDGTNGTVFGMSGIVSSSSMAAPVDGVATLTVTIALVQQIISGDAS